MLDVGSCHIEVAASVSAVGVVPPSEATWPLVVRLADVVGAALVLPLAEAV